MSIPRNEELRKARQRARRERLRAAAAELLEAFDDLYDLSVVEKIYLSCSWENGKAERWVGATYVDGSWGDILEYSRKDRRAAP